MRFVKINSRCENRKDCKRNFIATAKAEIDRWKKTYIIKADTADKCQHNISSKEKIKRFIKREITSFRNSVDEKKVTVAVTVVASLLMLLVFNINFTFAYNAFVNGEEVGFVPNKAYVEGCIDEINSEFSQYVSGQDIVMGKIVCVPAVIRRGAYTDTVTLSENIKSTSSIMTQAYAVEVNGLAYTALSDKAVAEGVLEQIISSYKNTETTEVYFDEDVQVVYEYVPMSILVEAEDAVSRLMGYTTLYHTVKVDAPVSAAEFAANNGMDMNYFSYLNPHIDENIKTDDEVIVPQVKTVVTVMTCDTVNYETKVPYEEQVTEDAMMYEGAERVIQRGADGVNSVTEKIIRANGDVVSQTILHTEVVSEPVVQLRAVGTKPRPQHIGTSSFIRPYYGKISSRFGARRSDYHSGVDLYGNTGDPIKAADSGIVIFSGWSGGYGNVVKIDHGNGYVTYYAHCSSLRVREGDVVSKGQLIATVGSTGNSSGPHLHFEVRYNDAPLNPMNYIN